MDESEKETLVSLHCLVIDCLDPLFIIDYLFQQRIIDSGLYDKLKSNPIRSSRCADFLMEIPKLCSFKELIDVFRFDDAYSFLANALESKLQEIKRRKSADIIPWYLNLDKRINRVSVHSKTREKITELRHKLKQLTLDGRLEEFYSTQLKLKQAYNNVFRAKGNTCILPENKRKLCADLLFIALDSEIEHRRIRFQSNWDSGDLFALMHDILKNTSNPILMTSLYLARKGSTLVMCGECVHDGLQLVQQAKEHGESLQPCRETGIILLIEFNLLCILHDANPTLLTQNNLIRIARESIYHFDHENDTIRYDFRLIISLKAAFIYLGIGLFCNISSMSVPDELKRHGESCLNVVKKEWANVQVRWRMIWFFASARVNQLNRAYHFALDDARRAIKIAEHNKFLKEDKHIRAFIEHCETKKNELEKTKIKLNVDENIERILNDC